MGRHSIPGRGIHISLCDTRTLDLRPTQFHHQWLSETFSLGIKQTRNLKELPYFATGDYWKFVSIRTTQISFCSEGVTMDANNMSLDSDRYT